MSLSFWICSVFLGFSLLAYALLGGADYGAGAVEITLRGDKRAAARRVLEKAIGPVWEANHIWLILAVVILFMGFPSGYALLSVALHIPLTCALLGIVARGTSFTFRHYDAIRDGSRPWYNWIFRLSSVWTPFWLGITVAGMSAGRVPHSVATGLAAGMEPGGMPASSQAGESAMLQGGAPHALAPDFMAAYIAPWWHLYGIFVGLFTVALFAFLASVYLIGESRDVEVRTRFARRARAFLFTAIPLGALVFLAAHLQGMPLITTFLHHPLAMACVLVSATSLIVLENGLRLAAKPETVMRRRIPWGLRVLAGAQGMAIISAWFLVQYPVLFAFDRGTYLTIFAAAAPEATLRQLAGALVIGSILILPALFWLYRLFNSLPPLVPQPGSRRQEKE
jgi:cytochrome bd ubiquinol oxidase subunit II